jgi:hypothetical protein
MLKKILSSSTAALTTLLVAGSTPALAQLSNLRIEEGNLPTALNMSPSSLITNLVNIAFIIAVILVFFYLIWGGIEWITSGGDKGKTESARNKITSAVIGLIVLAASYAILTLTLQLLGYDSLDQALTGTRGNLQQSTVGTGTT